MTGLVVEHAEDVAIVRVARPERRNALTLEMIEQLADVVEREVDSGAVAVIISGDNEIFSSGVDLGDLGHGVADAKADMALAVAAERLRAMPVPLVAAIEGACVGGAVELALACDARVLADGGYFSIPATRLGILYRPEGVAHLVAAIGRETVARLFLFNERVGADDALLAHLATHRCPNGEAVAWSLRLCDGISRDTMMAVRATKELVYDVTRHHYDLSHWEQRRTELLSSDERQAALNRATKRRHGG